MCAVLVCGSMGLLITWYCMVMLHTVQSVPAILVCGSVEYHMILHDNATRCSLFMLFWFAQGGGWRSGCDADGACDGSARGLCGADADHPVPHAPRHHAVVIAAALPQQATGTPLCGRSPVEVGHGTVVTIVTHQSHPSVATHLLR